MRFPFLLTLLLPLSIMAQDILIKRNGQEIKTRIIKIERKEITYKAVDDPEFQTQTVNKKDVRMIRMEEGKIYDYDRVYPAPYVGIGGGLWMPVGRFKSTESDGETSPGFAMNGAQIKVGTGFYFSRKLGVAIEGRFTNSKFDNEAFDDKAADSSLYTSQTTDGNRYGVGYVFAGPMYSTLLGRKFTLDLKAMAGGLFVTSRTQHTKYFIDDGQNLISDAALDNQTDFDNAFTLGGGVGINLRYSIVKKLSVSLHCDYIYATPEIDFVNIVTDNTSFGFDYPDLSSSAIRSISGVNLGLSLNYEFNRRKDW